MVTPQLVDCRGVDGRGCIEELEDSDAFAEEAA